MPQLFFHFLFLYVGSSFQKFRSCSQRNFLLESVVSDSVYHFFYSQLIAHLMSYSSDSTPIQSHNFMFICSYNPTSVWFYICLISRQFNSTTVWFHVFDPTFVCFTLVCPIPVWSHSQHRPTKKPDFSFCSSAKSRYIFRRWRSRVLPTNYSFSWLSKRSFPSLDLRQSQQNSIWLC